ncbi:MAG: helix-turn-helix domain-containing protein [Pseudomonas sp.]|uniref:helix-turn-helix domain-containing protein n=1 Tax=Pseudomonas sp. TaxID=306 RepID=UPI00339576D7
MVQRWQGALWLARDYCLFAGLSGHTGVHAHYAHQAMLGRDGPLRVALTDQRLSAPFVLIESLQPHAFAEANQPLVAVYAEPLAFDVPPLRAALAQAPAELEVLAARMAQVERKVLDPRVEQALHALDRRLQGKVEAAGLAREVSLSLSQLQRLFGAQVGLSVRRLVLWRRLRLALRLALDGAPLTAAAHGAGFADSAHLSRTVRAMFGIRADHSLRHLQLRLLE